VPPLVVGSAGGVVVSVGVVGVDVGLVGLVVGVLVAVAGGVVGLVAVVLGVPVGESVAVLVADSDGAVLISPVSGCWSVGSSDGCD